MKRINGVLLLITFCSCYSCFPENDKANILPECNSDIRSLNDSEVTKVLSKEGNICEQTKWPTRTIDHQTTIDRRYSSGTQTIAKGKTETEKVTDFVKQDSAVSTKSRRAYVVIGDDYDPEELLVNEHTNW